MEFVSIFSKILHPFEEDESGGRKRIADHPNEEYVEPTNLWLKRLKTALRVLLKLPNVVTFVLILVEFGFDM